MISAGFLSDSAWLRPQLDFLLYLQQIRTEHFEFLDKFFLSVTIFGELWLPILLCAVVYWSVNTKSGMYLFSLFGMQLLVCQLFKLIACIYRPWILDDKIHPVKEAIAAAKSYSFPSGHSSTAASVLGGAAVLCRKNNKIFLFLLLLIFTVGFSRLWLGVHTPQDVIIGLLIGFVLAAAMKPVIDKADDEKNGYLYLMAAVNVFAAAALVFICCFNQYPHDYFGGNLLVNPQNAVYNTVNCYGTALGLINGACLCRHFNIFDAAKDTVNKRVLRGIIGTFSTFILLKLVLGYVYGNVLDYKYAFLLTFVSGLYVTLIFPMIFEFKAAK